MRAVEDVAGGKHLGSGARLQRAFPTDGLLCRSADARPTPSQDPAGQAAFGRRTTTDSIQLLEFEATSPDADPAVGDRITITFSLKNVAQAPRELAYTFVGARDPADDWSDFGEGNQSRVLQPGEALSVGGVPALV